MTNFRAILGSVFRLLATWLYIVPDLVVPKNKNLWLIASHSGLVGNARFLAERILESRPQIRVYFYSYRSGKGQVSTETYFKQRYGRRFRLVKRKNLTALITALSSRYIFISHDLIRDVGFPLTDLKGRRMVINLWHGIAMKKHWLLKRYAIYNDQRQRARQFSRVIASSSLDALAKAASFDKVLDDIWITGNPRNDIFMGKTLPGDLQEQELRLKGELQGRALVLYAPTWRSYSGSFQPFERDCLERLIATLNEYNHILGLRLHEKDEAKFSALYRAGIGLNLSSEKYPETGLLLKNTAILVTDYSSIWLDFLLTGRPQLAYWYDLEEYSEKRGFLWDMDELYPGTKVYTCAELEAALGELVRANRQSGPRPEYRFVKKLFHRYTDGNCTERVINKVISNPK